MPPNAVSGGRATRLQFKKVTNVAIEPPDEFERANEDDPDETNPQYWSIRCKIPMPHHCKPPKIVIYAKTIVKVGPRYHEECPGRRGAYSRTKIEWFMVLHAWEEDERVPGGKRTFLLLVPNTWISDCWRYVALPPDNFHYITADPKTTQFYEHMKPTAAYGEYDIYAYVRKNGWRIAETGLDFIKKASMVLPYDYMSDANGDPYGEGECAETAEVDFDAHLRLKSLPSSPIRWAPEVETVTALRGRRRNAVAAIKRAATNLAKGTEPKVRAVKRKVTADGKENKPPAAKPKKPKNKVAEDDAALSDTEITGLVAKETRKERRTLIDRGSKNDGHEKISTEILEVGVETVGIEAGERCLRESVRKIGNENETDKLVEERQLAEQREMQRQEQERILKEQREVEKKLADESEAEKKKEMENLEAERQRQVAEQVALQKKLEVEREAEKQKRLREDSLRAAEERRRREQHSQSLLYPEESPQAHAPTSESTPVNQPYAEMTGHMMDDSDNDSPALLQFVFRDAGGRRDNVDGSKCRRSLNQELFNNGMGRPPYYPPPAFNPVGVGSTQHVQGTYDGFNNGHTQTGVRQNAGTYQGGGGQYPAPGPVLPPPLPQYATMQAVRPSSSASVGANPLNSRGGDSFSSLNNSSFAPSPVPTAGTTTGSRMGGNSSLNSISIAPSPAPPTATNTGYRVGVNDPQMSDHVCCFSKEEADKLKSQVQFIYDRLYEKWEAKRKASQELTASETEVAKFPQHQLPFDLFSDLTNFCREMNSNEAMKKAFIPNLAAKVSGMQFVGGKARKLMTLLVTPRLLCNCVFDRKNGLKIIGVDSCQPALINGTPTTMSSYEWREGRFNQIPGFKELFVAVLKTQWRGTVKKVLQQFRNNTKSRNDKAKLRPLEEGEEYKYDFTELRDNDIA